MTVDQVLLIIAIVLFVIEGLRGTFRLPNINFGWLGLAVWALTLLI